MDEELLRHAVNEGLQAGRIIERRLWVIGIGFYFGVPLAVSLITLLAMILGNAPTAPDGGAWEMITTVHRDSKAIVSAPFRMISAFTTVAGAAAFLLGGICFAAVWLRVLRNAFRNRNSS